VKEEKENSKDNESRNVKQTCPVCGAAVDYLAEFNGQQTCSKCFEQAIQDRISGRTENMTNGDLYNNSNDSDQEVERPMAI